MINIVDAIDVSGAEGRAKLSNSRSNDSLCSSYFSLIKCIFRFSTEINKKILSVDIIYTHIFTTQIHGNRLVMHNDKTKSMSR